MHSEMLAYVERILVKNGGQRTKYGKFRLRSGHIRRVYLWAQRLLKELEEDSHGTIEAGTLDKEALLVAAIFHDSGYGMSEDWNLHPLDSAKVARAYLKNRKADPALIDFVCYLVENHSYKHLLGKEDLPVELVILMEADLLDETGALSIVWDCQVQGTKDVQSFCKTFEHIKNYSAKILDENPMVTLPAQRYWQEKQKLVEEFLRHLAFDIGWEHWRTST